MWKETTQQERNLKIYREELDDFLPETVLDFHVHVFNAATIRNGESFSCSGHPIKSYDLAELAGDLRDIYPGRKALAVCFGFPEVEYDRAENNRYLTDACDRKQFFPLRLFDPTEDTPEILRNDLSAKRFLGLKPYLNYIRKPNPNDVEIHEMLPSWAMEIVNDLGTIVVLHIPRSARLADPRNQRQIVELAQRYPQAKIILAHIGRAYFLKNVIGNLDALKPYSNLYFDLAMVNHWEVMEYLFCEIPANRIIYGTDIPLAIAPGKSVEINDQYTYVTPVPWSLSISDDRQKIRFTSFLYEELRAVKKAARRLNLGREFMEGLFYQNGMRLLNELINS